MNGGEVSEETEPEDESGLSGMFSEAFVAMEGLIDPKQKKKKKKEEEEETASQGGKAGSSQSLVFHMIRTLESTPRDSSGPGIHWNKTTITETLLRLLDSKEGVTKEGGTPSSKVQTGPSTGGMECVCHQSTINKVGLKILSRLLNKRRSDTVRSGLGRWRMSTRESVKKRLLEGINRALTIHYTYEESVAQGSNEGEASPPDQAATKASSSKELALLSELMGKLS